MDTGKAAARLAAKFSRKHETDYRWHPLICHMVDVAMVAEVLWQERLSDGQRRLLAEGLGLDVSETGTWVAFMAGAHDAGSVLNAILAPTRASRMPWACLAWER